VGLKRDVHENIAHRAFRLGVAVRNLNMQGFTFDGLPAPVGASAAATKGYVDALFGGNDFQESVIDEVDFTVAEPGAPALGARYINTATGLSSGTGQAVTATYIYEWNGTTWTETVPDEGTAVYVEDVNLIYIYNGGVWSDLSGFLDHGTILGLGDDDHAQYHNDARGDARYRTQAELASTTPGSEGTTLVGHHAAHTLHDLLDHTLNKGKWTGCVVSDAGGLNVTWTAGEIYDESNAAIRTINANPGGSAVTNNAVNFVYWDHGVSDTVLQVSTVIPTAVDTLVVAIVCAQDNDIRMLLNVDPASTRLSNISLALVELFPARIVDGMIVSEDLNVVNPLDVSMSAGAFYNSGHHRATAAAIDSRTVNLVRHFHDAGDNWTTDTDPEIDTVNYDDPTDGAVPKPPGINKWMKAFFVYSDGVIHWVYPQTFYNTEAQAFAATIPTKPPGLAHCPNLFAIVYRAADADFTRTTWIDIRPGIACNAQAVVADHGTMTGLGDDDHPQYLLVADIDDAPVNGETTAPISSNWAFDHDADADAHHNEEPNLIPPAHLVGVAGFVVSVQIGAIWTVAKSDINAAIEATFKVEHAGSFKVTICYGMTTAAATCSGVLSVGVMDHTDAYAWLGTHNGVNFDLTSANPAEMTFATYGTAFSVTAGEVVGVSWQKDDNAGGAAGNIDIFDIVLERQ
jgi:hypothetical protein